MLPFRVAVIYLRLLSLSFIVHGSLIANVVRSKQSAASFSYVVRLKTLISLESTVVV